MFKKLVVTIFLLLGSVLPLSANVIVPWLFSEILPDTSDWIIELDLSNYYMDVKLDSCYLMSNWGVARIKPCQLIDGRFYLITNDSLESPLTIFPEGDVLIIKSINGSELDFFGFGSVVHGICPLPGQSINKYYNFYYLDNTPTFGRINDTLNASGLLQGSITDSSGAPVSGITAYWSYENSPDWELILDGEGNFSQSVRAAEVYIMVNVNENWKLFSYQVYPESTVTAQIVIQKSSSAVNPPPEKMADGYKLANNYPNPFNSSTVIHYEISNDDFVEINILDINGRLVEKLFSGFQGKGEYSLLWDAFSVPSGIYIYQLRTARVMLSKKCLLLK